MQEHEKSAPSNEVLKARIANWRDVRCDCGWTPAAAEANQDGVFAHIRTHHRPGSLGQAARYAEDLLAESRRLPLVFGHGSFGLKAALEAGADALMAPSLPERLHQAHQQFCLRVDKELEHYAAKIAKRAFRAAIDAVEREAK